MKKIDDNPKNKKCDLCGKLYIGREKPKMWIGGYVGFAHIRCAKIGNKAVELFMKWKAFWVSMAAAKASFRRRK